MFPSRGSEASFDTRHATIWMHTEIWLVSMSTLSTFVYSKYWVFWTQPYNPTYINRELIPIKNSHQQTFQRLVMNSVCSAVKRISKISATSKLYEKYAPFLLQFSRLHHKPRSHFNWLHTNCYIRLPSVILLHVAMVLWSKFCYVAAPCHSAFTVWMSTWSQRGNASSSVLWRYDGRMMRTESAAAHQFCSTAAFVRAGGILLARSPARRGRPPLCAWHVNQQRYRLTVSYALMHL